MIDGALQDSLKDTPVAMVLSDPNLPDNPLVYVNNAFEKVTLYARDAAIGRNCRFLQCDETDANAVRELRVAIEAGREVSVDLVNQKADGARFLNRLVIAPLRDEQGEIHAFLGIQSEIPRDDDAKGSSIDTSSQHMLRELQHRVKNHLAMVVGLIRIHSRREVTKESFDALGHRVQSLALLYEELSPNGVISGRHETLPAGAYLSRVANTIGSLDGRSSIRVNVRCDDVELPVEVGARLGMLLTEFVTNALEHAFAGRTEGLVSISFTRQTRGKLRMTVEDDGVGMPDGFTWPASAPSLETRASEAKAEDAILNTRGTKRKSGAGGSIVQAMVEYLDGDLRVSSTKHGTTVTLDIVEPAFTP